MEDAAAALISIDFGVTAAAVLGRIASLEMTNIRLFHTEASRRTLLRRFASPFAVIALASRAGDAFGRRGKRSQRDVAYQDTPKGNQRCEICTSFLPPDQCRTVVGPAGRQGWCNIYEGPG
jgi:hypothetical protein